MKASQNLWMLYYTILCNVMLAVPVLLGGVGPKSEVELNFLILDRGEASADPSLPTVNFKDLSREVFRWLRGDTSIASAPSVKSSSSVVLTVISIFHGNVNVEGGESRDHARRDGLLCRRVKIMRHIYVEYCRVQRLIPGTEPCHTADLDGERKVVLFLTDSCYVPLPVVFFSSVAALLRNESILCSSDGPSEVGEGEGVVRMP